jgi:Ca2+-binding RTX toxin-like protein
MTNDLMAAILAMDVYNRTSNEGVFGLPGRVGAYVGGARIIAIDDTHRAQGFYAVAYEYNGKRIISYRGTDKIDVTPSGDILTGWVVGGGLVSGNQAQWALDFYRQVTGKNAWEQAPGDVVLTGHSLGGGLAGYVGSITHAQVVAFDHMPFGVAALSAYALEVINCVAASVEALTLLGISEGLSISARVGALLVALPTFGAEVIAEVLSHVTLPPAPSWASNVQAYHVDGEVMQLLRSGAATELGGVVLGAIPIFGPLLSVVAGLYTAAFPALEAGVDNTSLSVGAWHNHDPMARHSQALEVLLMYALPETGNGTGHTFWNQSNLLLNANLDAWFSDDVGEAIGLKKDVSGRVVASDQMLRMIAYSIIQKDEAGGGSGQILFGDTAVRALFNDADDVGRAVADYGSNELLSSGGAAAIAKIYTQYAGELAWRLVTHDQDFGNLKPIDGVISYDSTSIFTIDLTKELWSVNNSSHSGEKPDVIAGLKDLISVVANGSSATEFSSAETLSHWLWGDEFTPLVEKIGVGLGQNSISYVAPSPQGQDEGKVAVFLSSDGSDHLVGSAHNDLIAGGAGDDIIEGGDGRDLLSGGSGDDTLNGGKGINVLFGGDGDDIASFTLDGAQSLSVSTWVGPDGVHKFIYVESTAGEYDELLDIERVRTSEQNDIIRVSSLKDLGKDKVTFDGNSGRDQLNLSGVNNGLYFDGKGVRNITAGDALGAKTSNLVSNLWLGDRVDYENIEQIVGTHYRDIIDDSSYHGEVFLGDGDDVLRSVGAGAIVHLGTGGKDIVHFSAGAGVTDLDASDQVWVGNNMRLFGGLRAKTSEHNYVTSWGGVAKYGLNAKGELVIHVGAGTPDGDPGRDMYFLGWANTQRPQGEGGATIGAGGIFLADFQIDAYRIMENYVGQGTYFGTWALFGLVIKAMTGWDAWSGQDPLVLDLDGDGFDLTAINSWSPTFDVDADLYGEQTGWVGMDDGMLARDIDGDGQINDSRELFGGRTSGFAVLAALDGNGDGVINAADNGLADFDGDGVINAADGFDDLKVWRDLDQDGKVAAGELQSLSTYDIVGLNLAQTIRNETVAGNLIAATSSFIRGDGSTGLVGEAILKLDNANTVYLGAPITISAAAASEPNLKGFGTLVSLREALSVEASGLALVDASLAALNAETGHDLASIRAAIRPLLKAWAEGSPIRAADGTIIHGAEAVAAYSDIPVIRTNGAVSDYAWDRQTSVSVDGLRQIATYKFVSGMTLTLSSAAGQPLPILADLHELGAPTVTRSSFMINGQTIWQSSYTFADGSSLVGVDGSMDSFDTLLFGDHDNLDHTKHFVLDGVLGSDLAFFERYLGEILPFHEQPGSVSAALQAIDTAIANMELGLNLIGARVAVQASAFADVFEGLQYNADDNTFTATTHQQLIPTFTNLLELSAQHADPVTWLKEWKPLFDVLIADFNRGGGLLVTNGWLAQNIVGAFEAAHPAFDLLSAVEGLGLDPALFSLGDGEVLGTGEADIFYLDAGDQVLKGGLGLDNYIVGGTFGHDVIEDIEGALRVQSEDVLRFTRHLASDFLVERDGIDLVMTVLATGETLRITGQFYGEWAGPFGNGYWPDEGVDAIVFADGTSWDQLDMAQAASRIDQGSTTVLGTADNDYLDGGAGNDRLEGAGDSDVYVFGRGYGHDTIWDEEDNAFRDSVDVISFRAGISRSDLTFSRDGANEDLLITISGGGSLKIEGQFSATYTGTLGIWWINQIELLSFADGSYLTYDQLFDIVLNASETNGDDIIYGFDREDILDGRAGDDFLSGGNEADTYVFGRGYGHDVIQDKTDILLGGTIDTLSFNADTAVSDVVFTRDGEDLIATITATGDSVRLVNEYEITETGPFGWQAWDMIDRFVWADGTVKTWWDAEMEVLHASETAGNDIVLGTHFDDVFNAGTGDDQLFGGNGADTYVFAIGDGHDIISDHLENWLANDGDVVSFQAGISADDIVIERFGPDLLNARLTVGSTGDSISIINEFAYTSIGARDWEVETFNFADGTAWTAGDLRRHYLLQQTTSGNDVIEGFWTNDTLVGGAGDDILRGGDSDDTYTFEQGFGHDVIEEGVYIISYDDDDQIIFGDGLYSTNARLTRDGDNLIIGFAGMSDTVTIVGQFTKLAYFQGWSDIETINFADGVSWTDPQIRVALIAQSTSTGADHTSGFAEADVFYSSAGDDVIEGFGGGDLYHFGRGSGHDKVYESINTPYEDQDDTLVFDSDIAVADVRFVRDGNDLVISIVGASDTLTVVGHFDYADFDDIELFRFADGTVLTSADVEILATAGQATSGDDLILGTPRDNLLDGGAGDDRLEGGRGDDSYVFGLGYGHDTISDFDNGLDKVLFGAGVMPAMVTGHRQLDDLVLTVGSNDDTLIVENYFSLSYFLVEEFRFADGTVWGQADINVLLYGAAAPIVGTQGGDSLIGAASDDVIVTLDGFDTATGGDGSDTYFVGEHGKTIIEAATDGDNDVVRLEDATSSQVVVTRSGGDAVLTYVAGSVRLVGQFAAAAIEHLVFSDGVTWSAEDLRTVFLASAATANADDILGFEGRDDTIAGGAGDDLLRGVSGGDSYLFGLGGGHDTVRDLADAASIDKLVLAAGIVAGDIVFLKGEPTANDLTLKIGSSAQVVLEGELIGDGSGVEQVVFADGTTWDRATLLALADSASGVDQTLHGDAGANTLAGGAGNDSLHGGAGDDTYGYEAGGGVDTIYEGEFEGYADEVVFGAGLTFDKLQVQRDGSTAKLSFDGVAGSLILDGEWNGYNRGVELFVFDGGVRKTAAELSTLWLERQVTSGADTIIGFSGADILRGGMGDDLLSGGTGDDTYLYDAGDGADVIEDPDYGNNDRLVLGAGLTFDKLQLQRSGDTAILSFVGYTGSITLNHDWSGWSHGVETITFGDGVQKTVGQLANIWLLQQATTGNDTISGFANLTDILQGGLGNDVLSGNTGDDTYLYNVGDGYDRIVEAEFSGNDKLVLGSGLTANLLTVTQLGDALTLSFTGFAGSVTLAQEDNVYGAGVEQIVFGNGLIWTRQDLLNAVSGTAVDPAPTQPYTTGNDLINGTSGTDVLAGGLGDDTLNGGNGSDIYRYNDGDGADLIVESPVLADTDRLVLGAGLNASDIVVTRSGSYGALISFAGHAGSILMDNQFNLGWGYGVERLQFADGTVWGTADLLATYMAHAQTVGNDTIQGFASSADILRGGLGDDSLSGDSGSDTYVYNDGDGADRIYESYAPDDTDVLVFGAGLSASDLVITRGGSSNATLSFRGHAGSVSIDSVFYGWGYGVEQFRFADGAVLGVADLRAAYLIQAQTAQSDTIQGFDGAADTLRGGLGDDSLSGLGGSDTYLYNVGDGVDRIYESYTPGDTDTLIFGAGLLTTDLTFSRAGSATVTLGFAGRYGSVTLDSQFSPYASYGIEKFQFADGTVWSVADLRGAYLTWAQTSGSDTIVGFDGVADTLQGGLGDDSLTGYDGSDTYLYADGDGADKIYESYAPSDTDKLVFGAGLNVADLIVTRSSSTHATLAFSGHQGSIFIDSQFSSSASYGIEQFQFADGTVLGVADLRANYLTHAQTAGNDTILGFGGLADTLHGGMGNDTLTGYDGSDTYLYNDNDGFDKIYESYAPGDTDTLTFGTGLNAADLLVTRSGDSATISFAEHYGSIVVDGQFSSYASYGIEQFQFADGTVISATQLADLAWYRGGVSNDTIIGTSGVDRIDGGAGNDTLSGASGADVLVGGAGNDSLSGEAGADSFIFNTHFGSDTVTDFKVDGADVLEFHGNLFADFADLLAHSQQVGADVVITHASDETVTLRAVQLANFHQDDFRFVA